MRLSSGLAWLSALLSLCHSKYAPGECPRIRQPMHMLTTEELSLYADGLHRIRANGKYQVLVNSHAAHREMHRGSSFFFYHTYFVWEVETQIRALGGKFTCFALPYYDWTIDAGREANPWILNTVLGGRGDPDNLLCVTDEAWTQQNWNIRETCDHEHEDAHIGCCLKRDLWGPEDPLGDVVEVGGLCERTDFEPFSGGVAFYHQKVHWLFGRGDLCTKCAMATGYSPDDPIFMALHSFAAYLRAIWASCHGYDNISEADLDQHPEAYKPGCSEGFFDGECGTVEYDDAYEWEDLADMEWSITSQMDITPRMMWDFDMWNVAYNHGTFYEASGLSESEFCDGENVAGSRWFSEEGPLYGYVQGQSAYEIWAQGQEGGVDAFRREIGESGQMVRNVNGRRKRRQREEEVQGMYLSEVGMMDGESDVMMAGIIVLLMAAGVVLCLYNRRVHRNVQKVQVVSKGKRDVEMSYGALSPA